MLQKSTGSEFAGIPNAAEIFQMAQIALKWCSSVTPEIFKMVPCESSMDAKDNFRMDRDAVGTFKTLRIAKNRL